MFPTQGRIQRAESFPYLLGLSRLSHFEIDEMATRGGTHLALRFFNEQRLAHSHKGRASTASDTGDMGGNESRIGGGGDNGGVHSGLI